MKKLPSYSKTTYLLVLLILLIFLGSLTAIFVLSVKKPAQGTHLIANVYLDGTLIRSIDLSLITESYTFSVSGEDGAYNEIAVEPGKIAILHASCPDKLCVHQGFISSPLLPIICLPNRLVIRITEETAGPPSVDALTY